MAMGERKPTKETEKLLSDANQEIIALSKMLMSGLDPTAATTIISVARIAKLRHYLRTEPEYAGYQKQSHELRDEIKEAIKRYSPEAVFEVAYRLAMDSETQIREALERNRTGG